jgi:hypothetical protein
MIRLLSENALDSQRWLVVQLLNDLRQETPNPGTRVFSLRVGCIFMNPLESSYMTLWGSLSL